jgi:hypothetical protein
MNQPGNQTICEGSSTQAVTFSGSNNVTVYEWTNSNTAIGLAASGRGDIPSFVGQNLTSNPITGTITVTPYDSVGGGVRCPGPSVQFTITVNPLPTVTVANPCVGAGTVTFTQNGASTGGTWSVSGGGTINASTGVFTPTTAGCFTATYTTATLPGCLDTKSFLVFPAAPVLTAANTCNTAFTLPSVMAVAGFTIEYNIDGTGFTATPTIPTSSGCHTIQARYVLTNACGTIAAGATSSCATSNIISVVIFPPAPSAPTVSTGCGAFSVSAPPSVSGFNIEYSFDDGATWGANTPPTADNCTGYKIRTRYVTATNCGNTLAGTAGTGACGMSPATTRKVDNTKPVLTCPTINPVCEVPTNTYTIPALVASDNCTVNSGLTIAYSITGATIRSGAGVDASGAFNLGVSTITWTVTDECGNSNTCTTQVTINPKPVPVIYHN